jgi:hypothetical protein
MTKPDEALSPALTLDGPYGYRNWKASREQGPSQEAVEFALYSDTNFTGQLMTELGPFQVINPVPLQQSVGRLQVALVLRMTWHLPELHEQMNEQVLKGITDTSAFHGGTPADEIAALLSLTIGARLQAGGIIREFRSGGDPRGTPRVEDPAQQPLIGFKRLRPTLPLRLGSKALVAAPLETYPDLDSTTASELLRAARSYQQALLVSDSDPALSWLLLVSAVETAAAEWTRIKHAAPEDPVKLLRILKPDFVQRIEAAAHEKALGVLNVVAKELSHTLRSQYKFVTFLETFCPGAITPRPTATFAINWAPSELTSAFKTIYALRSKALHASIPFPPPMSQPPFITNSDENGTPISFGERPIGTTATAGGVWAAGDMPMNLHTFDFITRGSLINFWKWAAQQSTRDS